MLLGSDSGVCVCVCARARAHECCWGVTADKLSAYVYDDVTYVYDDVT
jgi:hypothetical protein